MMGEGGVLEEGGEEGGEKSGIQNQSQAIAVLYLFTDLVSLTAPCATRHDPDHSTCRYSSKGQE